MTAEGACSQDSCTATFANHKWGKIAASEDGWFFMKDGTNWCPQHNPDWVEAWRRRAHEDRSCSKQGCERRPHEKEPIYLPGGLIIRLCMEHKTEMKTVIEDWTKQ